MRPYTAWWLRGHPVLDGRRPAGLRSAGGDPLLAGLYESADAGDGRRAGAAGARRAHLRRRTPGRAGRRGGAAGPPRRPRAAVGAAQLHALYGAAGGPRPRTGDPARRAAGRARRRGPGGGRGGGGGRRRAGPGAAGRRPRRCCRYGPPRAAELAELLQVRRLSEAVERRGPLRGRRGTRCPEAVRVLLGAGTPEAYMEHEELLVDDGADDGRTGLAPDPGRHPARRDPGGRGGRPGLGGGPVAAPLRGGRPAGGPRPGRGTGAGALVRLSDGARAVTAHRRDAGPVVRRGPLRCTGLRCRPRRRRTGSVRAELLGDAPDQHDRGEGEDQPHPPLGAAAAGGAAARGVVVVVTVRAREQLVHEVPPVECHGQGP